MKKIIVNTVVIYLILTASMGVIIYNHFFLDLQPIEPMIQQEGLDGMKKQAFDIIFEMIKLLITLSSALFGLIGYFVLEHFKNSNQLPFIYRVDAITAFCCAAISIDFGYIAIEKCAELFFYQVFNPQISMVALPSKLQLIFFLIALVFTAKFILKNLIKNV